MSISKNVVIQIGLGITIVTVVFLICMWIMQKDQILDQDAAFMRPTQLEIDVVKGYGNLRRLSEKQWSTNNQAALNFLPLLPSYNRKGGVQFSYSFWIKVDTFQGGAQVAGQTIILRGDRKLYNWTRTTKGRTVDTPSVTENMGPDVLIKCPRIRFGQSFDELVVEFNTLGDPSSSFKLTSISSPDPERLNALSIIQGRWALLTFVFEDNVGISNFEDGIMIRVYLNGDLYYTHRQKGTFRRNQGDLFMAPGFDASINNVDIGDLKFYNYAVDHVKVGEIFRQGPPMRETDELQQQTSADPNYLSEYNKLDIYNNS